MVSMSVIAESPVRPVPGARRTVRPLEGKERARHTDTIVSDLRDARRDAEQRELTRQLIETNASVARSMAARYRNRGVDLDDLELTQLAIRLVEQERPTVGRGTPRANAARMLRDQNVFLHDEEVLILAPTIAARHGDIRRRLAKAARASSKLASLARLGRLPDETA